MSGISPQYTECVVFVYASVDDAAKSRESGGSGFVVVAPSDTGQGLHAFAVTNRHVVDGDFRVVRFSGDRIGTTAIELDWVVHPNGDDVAVAFIPPEVPIQRALGLDRFVTQEMVNDTKFNLLPGDDVFMAGRTVGLDRRVHNTPAARFGSVSMATPEQMADDEREEHEYFLVEMRSMPGYSGSPVFRWVRGVSVAKNALNLDTHWIHLLGIDAGHIHGYAQVVEWNRMLGRYVHIDQPWFVEEHSGMARVVPAWKILELLETNPLAARRKQPGRAIT